MEKDLLTYDQEPKNDLLESFKWWEKKRVLFNILVGATGLVGILFSGGFKITQDIIGVFVWGIAANLFFFIGFLLEPIQMHYFRRKQINPNQRQIIFWLGTIGSMLLTFFACMVYSFFVFGIE